MLKYFIETFGCQMNLSDSERICRKLESFGYKKAKGFFDTDLIIYNTCSIKQKAEDKVLGLRKHWAQAKKHRPNLVIAITGCMVAHEQYDLKKILPEIDFVFKITELPEISQKLLKHHSLKINQENKLDSYFKIFPKSENKFNVFVPIMTGCNNFCSYCIVPFTRGREQSRPAEEIIEEVQQLIKEGAKELTLLGQNVNSYQGTYKNKPITFPTLLKLITKLKLERIRFTSPHPKDFSPELINLIAEKKNICNQIHLPAQSGNNQILKAMNRNYTHENYMQLVNNIRTKIPNISLSTDIIVGFPNETDNAFQDTISLFHEAKFDMAFISMYSPRPGTLAAKYNDNIPLNTKKARFRLLTKVLKDISYQNNLLLKNKIIPVLVDQITKKHNIGKSETNKIIHFSGSNINIGDIVNVKITTPSHWLLKGELIN